MIIYKTAENVNKQVTNLAGDPAFKPVVKIPVPQEVSVKRSAKECASQLDEYLLICNIPGPMSAGTDYRVVQHNFSSSTELPKLIA